MSLSQNSNENDSLTADEVGKKKDIEAPAKSYYYDDSTGYEGYDSEDDQNQAGPDELESHCTDS